jgi:hypothetical protein
MFEPALISFPHCEKGFITSMLESRLWKVPRLVGTLNVMQSINRSK